MHSGCMLSAQAQLDTLFLLFAAVLVFLMQAGFLLLEVGLVRAKNGGSIVAKAVVNLALVSLAYWAIGFALAFGGDGSIAGSDGFFLTSLDAVSLPALSASAAAPSAKFLFQLSFCAVSLAIVWGVTLERMRFWAYVIFAVVFGAVIYPLASHWVFGAGWLQSNLGMQDFAGSTAVHLVGATAALAALLLLGPRAGKYGEDGKPRAIHGHSLPLAGCGVLLIWIGWFGFNPGSALSLGDGSAADVAVVTQLGAAGGVLGALVLTFLRHKMADVALIANGALAGLVAITAPAGYVEMWAAPIIGIVAGALCVAAIELIERRLDDPIGALSAHGITGIWGTLSCGIFTSPRLAESLGVGHGGLVYTGSFEQLGVQALGVVAVFTFVLASSALCFWLIKKTVGLRVAPEIEEIGLDVAEHGVPAYSHEPGLATPIAAA